MIVADDNGAGASENGRLKDLARVNERRRCGSDGDDLVADGAMSAVEIDGDEMLTGVVRDDLAHKTDRRERSADGGRDPLRASDVADGDFAGEVDVRAIVASHVTLRVA
jgi:hypothetical protein